MTSTGRDDADPGADRGHGDGSVDDAELVRRSAAGDTDAFRLLYDRKHRRLWRIAYQVVGDAGAAEDVVQEAFLALWEHAGRYRPRFAVDSWLNRIATNKAIDRWRRERGRRDEPAEDVDVDADETAAHPEAASAVAVDRSRRDPSSALGLRELQGIWDELAELLSARQRAAFVLREIEGLPVAEVAASLECSKSAVRSHISLARKKLRDALAERYPEYLPPVKT